MIATQHISQLTAWQTGGELIADEWYNTLVTANFVNPDALQAKTLLSRLTQQIFDLLYGERLEPRAVRAIGASLVPLCQNKPLVLARTQSLLARRLSELLPPEQVYVMQPRLAALLSELAVGFLESQAREARTITRSLLSGIGHELNTSLNLITGFSNILMRGMSGPLTTLQQEDVSTIYHASEELQKRFNQMFDLVKVETGVKRLDAEWFEVPDFLNEITMTIESRIKRNENTLVIEIANDVDHLITDQSKLAQVLLALLDNATKFTVQGTITLEVRRESSQKGDWLVFKISDTGIGMTAKQLQLLLPKDNDLPDPLAQENHASQGLLISRRLCYLMGGSLSGSSQVGKGSTFIVRLPA